MTSNDIPASWLILDFNEIFSQVSTSGKKVKSADVLTEGRFPVVDQGRSFISGYLDDANLVVSENKPLIIFGDHTREIKWIDFPFIPGADGVQILKPHPEMDTRFLYYFLRNLPIESRGYARHFKIVKDAAYLVPPLAEQTRIAAKLDELLAQVDTLKACIDGIPSLLKRFRQSVLAAAVSGRLTDEWRGAVRENSDGQGFSYPVRRLGVIARFIDYRGKTPEKVDSGIPLITAKNIKSGYISRVPREFIRPEAYESWMTRGIPKVGDVLITTEAPLGNVAVIDITEKFALAQRAICLQFHEGYSSSFAAITLQSSLLQEELARRSTGTTVKGIKASVLKEIGLPAPSIDEQNEIVHRVEQLFAYAEQLETKVSEAKKRIDHLAQSILAKAFKGDLVPQDPNDEPADVLLERIKAQRTAAPKAKRSRQSATTD
ncbi:restriction endonuclease subunit S [Pseudomonas syringae]|uniref:Type I restriction-modification system, S subunit n=1 Tax=Pseudomonas syringae pv. aceris TaxID=199198 RepID=A0A0L8IY97_PSESX|nr:restriction endonuclease subunit S [Pseudomonas syringae]EGH69685.1 type I restriction-modification system, S subunit [Pseudomonas syringae pv. aceris str. M302273]KOG06373.1 Type I restriction-modification system, S subunit [Pseudomonas syringae pv. aceris]KPW22349.1 Type I restriction-modification system, S subunit [Pseudomonas syringae pv. aceris]